MEDCLNKLLTLSETIDFDESSKIVLFSDCHRGDNSWADDFSPNESLLHYALHYYYKNGFKYIEVGDGDEMWENSFRNIWEAHYRIFELMQKFYDPKPEKNRLYLIYGNHDIEKRNPDYVKDNLERSYQHHYERKASHVPLFEGIKIHEGLILKSQATGRKILVIHGHQGDLLCDNFWWMSKFLVRVLWKPLQQISGFKDPTSPAKNFRKQDKIDGTVKEWISKHENTGVIMGHTHRPWCARSGEVPYFNTGSCVHPRCITGIEITNNKITLIKWGITAGEDGKLFVKREELDPHFAL